MVHTRPVDCRQWPHSVSVCTDPSFSRLYSFYAISPTPISLCPSDCFVRHTGHMSIDFCAGRRVVNASSLTRRRLFSSHLCTVSALPKTPLNTDRRSQYAEEHTLCKPVRNGMEHVHYYVFNMYVQYTGNAYADTLPPRQHRYSVCYGNPGGPGKCISWQPSRSGQVRHGGLLLLHHHHHRTSPRSLCYVASLEWLPTEAFGTMTQT